MPEFIDGPPGFDPKEHIANALLEIKNYTAIFVLEDGRVGSGIVVNSCGFDGILTAHHVAVPVLESEVFALCIAEYPHSLWVRSQHLEHVVVGESSKDTSKQQLGPDLSFLIIRDAKLLEILRSLKSFCFLDSTNLSYFKDPLERMYWAIAGSPHESYERIDENYSDGAPLAKLSNFAGEGVFQSRTVRDDFDY